MDIKGLFAAVHVRDVADSTGFYSRMLGRGPDERPYDALVQWMGFGNAGIQLFQDAGKAGGGVMTIVVPDVQGAGVRLAANGVVLGEIQTGDFGKVAHLTDPDGNTVYLVEPPKGGGVAS